MTNADRPTTAIINLTPAQADKIRTIARAQNKNESAVIEQLMSQQLDLMPRQGPGHTRAEILSITKNSSLADIMDPNTLWDETILDRHHQWMTNEHNQPLLSEFTIRQPAGHPTPLHGSHLLARRRNTPPMAGNAGPPNPGHRRTWRPARTTLPTSQPARRCGIPVPSICRTPRHTRPRASPATHATRNPTQQPDPRPARHRGTSERHPRPAPRD